MTTDSKPILVTGATGFIGARLLRELVTAGRRVRVLVRDPSRLPAPLVPRVDIVRGDLADDRAIACAMTGAGPVLHLAAMASAGARDERDFHRLNAEAVVRLLDAAARHGTGRFVHVSTAAVLPAARPASVRGLPGAPTPYALSKEAAEAAVRAYVAGGGDAVIVRPSRVYGPGPWNDANGATRLVAMYLKGSLRVRLRDGGARGNYVHVDDVVRGILLALQHGRNSEAYALGGEDATVPQFLDMVTRVSGVRRAVAAVPAQAVLPVAVAGRLACRLGLRASLTPAWLNHFLEDRPVGIAAARADLGYAPLGLEDGLRLTIGWLQQQRKGPWHVPVLQHG